MAAAAEKQKATLEEALQRRYPDILFSILQPDTASTRRYGPESLCNGTLVRWWCVPVV